MTTSSSSLDPIADLWREARAWLVDALRDLRGPAQIAKTLARDAITAARQRLLMIESLVMKLLLVEATRLHSSPACGGGRELPRTREEREGDVRRSARTRPSASRCALDSSPHCGEHNPAAPNSEDPVDAETWLVRFRLRIPPEIPRRAHGGVRPARLAPKPGAEAAHARAAAKARYLARRFEALRRVLADPRRAIARLARKLTALGRAAYAAARRIALARPRGKRLGPIFANAIVFGCDASFRFRADTS